MTTAFQFDPAALPHLRTRKALLILDLQNDFVADDGALSVTSPDGFVHRTIEVARAFREAGVGDVIWVRSLFEEDRPVANDQIVTKDRPMLSTPRTTAISRGRRKISEPPEEQPGLDDEAFLSLGRQEDEVEKPQCVRQGTSGSELAAPVAEAVDAKRDIVLTKTHYSAFESSQLLMRLRARFATELYICGALTNISIYATALDAGRYGLATTIIEDCCGYRSETRHTNAVHMLMQLTGCESILADDLAASLSPKSKVKVTPARASPPSPPASQSPPSLPAAKPPREEKPRTAASVTTKKSGQRPTNSSRSRSRSATGVSKSLPLRSKAPSCADHEGEGQAVERADSKKPEQDAAPSAIAELPSSPPAETIAFAPAKSQNTTPEAQPLGPALEADTDFAEGGNESLNFADLRSMRKATSRSGSKWTADEIKKHLLGYTEAGSARVRRTTPPGPKAQPKSPTGLPLKQDPSARQLNSSDTAAKAIEPEATLPLPTGTGSQVTVSDGKVLEMSTLPVDVGSASSVDAPNEVPASEADASPGRRPTATEPLCEGDTTVFHNALPPSIEQGIFERLREEVHWLRMSHQGGEVPRLVCVQGEVASDGSMPVYRHPADESPPLVSFTPTVVQIKSEVEKILGHPLNHVLIQFYRDGNDYISEHSDKTLDIVHDSYICNVSLGAERTMVFRTKRLDKDPSRKAPSPEAGAGPSTPPSEVKEAPAVKAGRQTMRAQLPHNSLCRMGLKTNMRWLHAIRQDKRMEREKSAAELAFGGGRISLTFRRIGTFLNCDGTLIWGQGATAKSRAEARPVVNGQTPEVVRMLQAFGTENHSSDFAWDKHYGEGFDVLHMSAAPRFFSGVDALANLRVRLLLAEYGVGYAKGSTGGVSDRASTKGDKTKGEKTAGEPAPVKFVDNDEDKSTVRGEAAVLLYLDAVYGGGKDKNVPRASLAAKFTRFQEALVLGGKWEVVLSEQRKNADKNDGEEVAATATKTPPACLKALKRELAAWDAYAAEDSPGTDILSGGQKVSVVDVALWPVLYDMAQVCGGEVPFVSGLKALGYEALGTFYTAFKAKACVRHVLGMSETQ